MAPYRCTICFSSRWGPCSIAPISTRSRSRALSWPRPVRVAGPAATLSSPIPSRGSDSGACRRSSPRKRGGGFTVEVQDFLEDLRRGCEVKAFSRGVVIAAEEVVETLVGESGEIGFARDEAAHTTDGVFDATLLPRGIGHGGVSIDGESGEEEMACELGAIIEGDSASQPWWECFEERQEMCGDTLCRLVGRPGCQQQPRMAIVDGEHGLAVSGEQHEVGFPMAGGFAVGGGGRPLGYGNTAFDEGCSAAAPSATEASFALAAGEIVAPAVVFGAGDLGVDAAVDALITDHLTAHLPGQPAGHLFGGPGCGEAPENGAAAVAPPLHARARPAPRLALFVSATWFVSAMTAPGQPYFT